MRTLAAVFMLVVFVSTAPPGEAAPNPVGAPAGAQTWSEAASLVPLDSKGVTLEKVAVEVSAPAAGPVAVTTTYTIANPNRRKATVRVALPLSYTGRIEPLDGDAQIAAAPPEAIRVTVGIPPVAIERAGMERIELAVDGPLGQAAPALAFSFEIDEYAATQVVVRQDLPWTAVVPARLLPTEKGVSFGFVGLDAWGPGREAVTATVATDPPLLGPASYAAPAPYRYDSKGLAWERKAAPGEALAVPERISLVVLADWAGRTFAGPYFARFAVPADDAYLWDHRFFHAKPVTTLPGGKQVLRAATVSDLIHRLDEIEQLILARNGKGFEDTFVQMRFQKEPWYKPNAAFSEDIIKPVEKWNLDYARCQARAARTVQSALEKMKSEEIPATGRRFKLLMEAFKRCDEQYWNPKPARDGEPRLLQ